MWTTVAEISKSILYGVSESAKTSGAYKLLRITDIQENNVDWDTVPFTDYDESKVGIYLLEENDILFARTGATVGKSYLVKGLCESSIYASYLIRVQTFKEILPQYVKYFFESGFYWEQIERSSIGIGQPNVNGTTLGNLRLPIPPINEQERIVSELKKWIAVITSIEANKNDLQGYIESAKSKILDLAIHGKLVPQDPNDEPANDLLRRINPQFTPCDNGHYTQLPQGWQLATMADICSLVDGEKLQGTEYPNLDVKYLRGEREAKMLNSGKFVSANTLMILVDGENSGEVFRAPIDGYQGSTFKQLSISAEMNEEYVLQVINLHRKALRENKIGSAIPHLNKKMFREIAVPVPPYPEQQRIVIAIRQWEEQLCSVLDCLQ